MIIRQLRCIFESLTEEILYTMKKIKILIASIALFAGIDAAAQNIISADQINVTLNASTSREQLFQIKTDMAAQGVQFNYQPQFNQERVLIAIQYELKDNTGKVLGKLESTSLANPNSNAGFQLNKQNGAFKPSCIGNCN